VREHDVGAATSRMIYGLRRSLWEAPRAKYGDAVAVAMFLGIGLVLVTGKRDALAWLVVGFLQILPLAWTALSNPIRRIPATALLGFGLIAIAAGTEAVLVGALGRNGATARLRNLDDSPQSPRGQASP
jgi:hypothetical protein